MSCNLNKKHKGQSNSSLGSGRQMSGGKGHLPQVCIGPSQYPQGFPASSITYDTEHYTSNPLRHLFRFILPRRSSTNKITPFKVHFNLLSSWRGFMPPPKHSLSFSESAPQAIYTFQKLSHSYLLSVICALMHFRLGFVSILYIIKVCCSVIVESE